VNKGLAGPRARTRPGAQRGVPDDDGHLRRVLSQRGQRVPQQQRRPADGHDARRRPATGGGSTAVGGPGKLVVAQVPDLDAVVGDRLPDVGGTGLVRHGFLRGRGRQPDGPRAHAYRGSTRLAAPSHRPASPTRSRISARWSMPLRAPGRRTRPGLWSPRSRSDSLVLRGSPGGAAQFGRMSMQSLRGPNVLSCRRSVVPVSGHRPSHDCRGDRS